MECLTLCWYNKNGKLKEEIRLRTGRHERVNQMFVSKKQDIILIKNSCLQVSNLSGEILFEADLPDNKAPYLGVCGGDEIYVLGTAPQPSGKYHKQLFRYNCSTGFWSLIYTSPLLAPSDSVSCAIDSYGHILLCYQDRFVVLRESSADSIYDTCVCLATYEYSDKYGDLEKLLVGATDEGYVHIVMNTEGTCTESVIVQYRYLNKTGETVC